MTEEPDDAQSSDALETRGLGEHAPPVGRRDAVAREPRLELQVHADRTIDRRDGTGSLKLVERRDAHLDVMSCRLIEPLARA